MTERQTLTGHWSGAYTYPGAKFPETVFEATIEEREGGAFTGSTKEPNLLRPWLESVITAEIEGHRGGYDVVFAKFMDGSGGMHHFIRYEGIANSDLTRIEGSWSIPRDWSGTFFMVRESGSVEKVALQETVGIDPPKALYDKRWKP